jgi:hypothetical protein
MLLFIRPKEFRRILLCTWLSVRQSVRPSSVRLLAGFSVRSVVFEPVEGNSLYLREMLTIMRRYAAERRFDLSQVKFKVILSNFVSISKYFVRSISFEPIEGN